MNQIGRFRLGILALVLLFGLAWYFLAYRPLQAKIAAANAATTAAQAQIAADRVQLVALVNDRRHAPSLQRSLQALSTALPNQFDLAAFIGSLDAYATHDGVTLTQIAPSSPAAGSSAQGTGLPPQVAAISFSLQASGTYHQVVSFLHSLDGAGEVVTVDSLQISSNGASAGSSPKLLANIAGRVYYHA